MKKVFVAIFFIFFCFSVCGCEKTAVSQKVKSTYETAVIVFSDVYNKGQTEKLEKLAPRAAVKYLKENENFDIEKRRAAVYEEYKLLHSGLIKIYGEDVKYTLTVNFKETLEKDVLKRMKEQFFTLYHIPQEDVKEVAVAHFTAEFSGNGKEDTQDFKIMVVNIADEWYVCNSYGAFGILKYDLYY